MAIFAAAAFAAAAFGGDDGFVLGADISWVSEMESNGARFKTAAGVERDLFALLRDDYGMKAVRLRVWVDPKNGWCGTKDTVEKAKRAKKAGMDVMIDFHYSDTWADPGHQIIPAAWAPYSNDVAKVSALLAAHTESVLKALKAADVAPKWVQIGNETASGFVWPTGHHSRPDGYAALFKAGYAAVKKVFPKAVVLVHLDRGHDAGLYDWNLRMLAERGAKWDMIGMSLYPWWAQKKIPDHYKTIAMCMENIRRLSEKWNCDVMIVETGVHNRTQEPETQRASRKELWRILNDARLLTNGRCRGVFYWEPECRESPYQLGAFTNDGRPTEIMEAYKLKPAPSLAMSLHGDGVRFSCGSMGEFDISHPRLAIGGEDRCKPIETRHNGNMCVLKYKDDGLLKVTLDGQRVHYRLEQTPNGYRKPFQEMYVPITFNQGGKWHVDSKSGDFPLVKGGAKLFQGNTRAFAVSDPNNAKLALRFSSGTWMEVQDNREWNWAIFWSGFHMPGGIKEWTVEASLDTSAFARRRLLDKFGQVARDFPGKISDESELKADLAGEAAYYKGLDFAGKLAKRGCRLDVYGGVDGMGAQFGLKKTGYFHCEKKNVGGRERWFLVDPLGNPFFHLGVCSFGPGEDYTDVTDRQDAYEWLPPHDERYGAAWKDRPGDWWNGRAVSFYKANVIRKYGKYDDEAQATRFVNRVRAVGFNSIGAFSDVSASARQKNFPYVGFVNIGSPRLIPSVRGMFDPFDEKSRAEVAKGMKSMARHTADPLLIGYFLANEQGLEDVSRAIPALDGSYAAKREFVAFLRGKYGAIAAFNTAWKADETDFKALEEKGLAVTTEAAHADVRAFTEIFLDAYYALIEREFRRNDPNHMLIGSRWQPATANDEVLCRVCGKYMDVVSINYYAAGIDSAFVTRIYEWSGRKPQFWSEFYYTSTKESNCGPSGFDLPTQKARGMAYRNYVEGAAALGFVVGIEWFTLIDQAATGRFFEGQNGERANTGLFNVLDRPYKDMLGQMLEAHLDIYPVWFGRQDAWKSSGSR